MGGAACRVKKYLPVLNFFKGIWYLNSDFLLPGFWREGSLSTCALWGR